MGKLIHVSDDVYNLLCFLKTKYKTGSFTKLLKEISVGYDTRDILIDDLNKAFKNLSRDISISMLNGQVGGLIERVRVMIVRIAQQDPNKRPEIYVKAEKILDEAMIKICKLCPIDEKK